MNEIKKVEIDDDFLAEVRARENEKHYKVFLPQEIIDSDYCGPLYGYYVENTGIYNIIDKGSMSLQSIELQKVGRIISGDQFMHEVILRNCSLLDPSDVEDFPELKVFLEKAKKKKQSDASIYETTDCVIVNGQLVSKSQSNFVYADGINENKDTLDTEAEDMLEKLAKEVDEITDYVIVHGNLVRADGLECFLDSFIKNIDNKQVEKLYEIIEQKRNNNGLEMPFRIEPWTIRLTGIRFSNGLKFQHLDTFGFSKVKIEAYSFIADTFSRIKGILESDKMLQKKAVIVGCGSGGSFIALELAKSGVGHFLLSDNDVFGYHNISRHQCGIFDVGKRKVDALKERILAINPYAEVVVYHEMIQKIYEGELDSFVDENTIILSCGDNRASAHHCNFLSEKYNVPFIAAGAGHRASTGEIFYYIPNTGMPCYSCVFGEDLSLDYSNEAQRVWYSTEEELEKQAFEPGLATDIDYISIIVCKLAIDLLTKADGKTKVLNFLPQYTAICNYLCDKDINPMIQIFQNPLQIKTKGLSTIKREQCYLCEKIANYKKGE